MFFIAESITCFYDSEQDRLNLMFNGRDREQLIGLMTRRFLKELLAQLPDWLIQQHQDDVLRTTEQQRVISSFQHQVSQQQVSVVHGKTKLDRQVDMFLIYSTDFTMNRKVSESGNQKIKLDFFDREQRIKITVVFTSEQLHKLFGEILKQVQSWDLENPWQIDDNFFVSSSVKDNRTH